MKQMNKTTVFTITAFLLCYGLVYGQQSVKDQEGNYLVCEKMPEIKGGLKALQKKGLVKLQNFQKKTNKISYLQYVITPKGISERTKLIINFMKRKMKEYDELKRELKKINKNVDNS